MSFEGEDQKGYFAPTGPGGTGLGTAAGTEALVRALARTALRNTPAARAAQLARALARALAKRGPLPTHRNNGETGGLPAGWRVAYEDCGGSSTAYSDGWTGTPGACQSFAFVFGDPQMGNPNYPYVQGWRKQQPGYVWPNYHDTTWKYERTTGSEPFAFSPPAPRVVPVPDPAWPIPLTSPQPLPLRPRPQRVTAPPLNPWEPPQLPNERPLTDVPLEVPWKFTPDLPTTSPDGEPIRGPFPGANPGPGGAPSTISEPFEDAEEWNRALPGPGPGPKPGPWPGPLSGVGPQRAPWQRPNARVSASPETNVRRNNNAHNTLPPYRGTHEKKPLIKARTAAMVAKALGRVTEGCDVVDAAFGALPLSIQQQYDSTKFLRGKPLSSPSDDFAGNAGHGAGSSSSPGSPGGGSGGSSGGNSNTAKSGYSANRQYSGRTFAQKRKAYNDKQKSLPPWAKSKWGRKATCQAKAKAVYDNLDSMSDKKFMKDLIISQGSDIGIGIVGKGAADHAKQTGRTYGWSSIGNGP